MLALTLGKAIQVKKRARIATTRHGGDSENETLLPERVGNMRSPAVIMIPILSASSTFASPSADGEWVPSAKDFNETAYIYVLRSIRWEESKDSPRQE